MPPPRPSTLTPGATADVRDAMARFSGPELHGDRRLRVEAAIDGIDSTELRRAARSRSVARLNGEVIDAMSELARVVPTEVLASALGIADEDLASVRSDLGIVVAVIGRGALSTPAADHATERLLGHFRAYRLGAVAAVSLLCQNHDASAALTAVTLLAHTNGEPRRSALDKTARVANRSLSIGSLDLEPQTLVTVSLDMPEVEFGAGPHRCPGQAIAEAIVAGIVEAIDASGYRLDIDGVAYGSNRRAETLPLRPVVSSSGIE